MVVVLSGRPSLGTLDPGQGSGPGFCPVSCGGCCCGGCVSRGLGNLLSPSVGDICPKALGVPGPVRHTCVGPLLARAGPWADRLSSFLHPRELGVWPAWGAVGSPPGVAGCDVMAHAYSGDVGPCSSRCRDQGIREGIAVPSFPSWLLRRSLGKQPQAGRWAASWLGGPRGRPGSPPQLLGLPRAGVCRLAQYLGGAGLSPRDWAWAPALGFGRRWLPSTGGRVSVLGPSLARGWGCGPRFVSGTPDSP